MEDQPETAHGAITHNVTAQSLAMHIAYMVLRKMRANDIAELEALQSALHGQSKDADLIRARLRASEVQAIAMAEEFVVAAMTLGWHAPADNRPLHLNAKLPVPTKSASRLGGPH